MPHGTTKQQQEQFQESWSILLKHKFAAVPGEQTCLRYFLETTWDQQTPMTTLWQNETPQNTGDAPSAFFL